LLLLAAAIKEEIIMANLNGTGRGIGREIALHQARSGAKVAVLARTTGEIDETASLIGDEGGVAIALPADLVDRQAVEHVLDRVASELGPIDLGVNNHGSFRAFGPIRDCDPDVWWQDVEINLRGTFHTCRVVASAMLARRKGASSSSYLWMKIVTIDGAENVILGLQDEIRRSEESRYDHRLHGVLLVAHGMNCCQVADILGDAPRTVAYWGVNNTGCRSRK
jgi:NAD(P)-dependent dehydrogenase (short-subunit alcohol dehydrogenase family)